MKSYLAVRPVLSITGRFNWLVRRLARSYAAIPGPLAFFHSGQAWQDSAAAWRVFQESLAGISADAIPYFSYLPCTGTPPSGFLIPIFRGPRI